VSKVWRNWGRSESATPVEVTRPQSTDEVAAIVKSARERNLRVKPIGTGHSFSGVAVAPGIQLNMSGMTGLLGHEGNNVTLGSGTVLHDLPPLLDPLGLAFQNMGDIDVQTVSGATSTGTHGTGKNFGGLATRIRGAKLVTGDGEILEVNAKQNADLLPAVALGIGALGVLTEITIEAVPSFVLHVVEKPQPLEPVLEHWQDLIDGADHFEFYWFPHTEIALTKTSTRLPADAQLHPLPAVNKWFEDTVMSNHLYRLLTNFERAFPRTTPAMNRFSSSVWGDREFTNISHHSFATQRTLRFKEMEYALPQAEIPEVLRAIDALIERKGWTVSFPVEIRAAAADDLWMSTATGRPTGYIAVHRQFHENPTEYFQGVEEIMKAHDGRPHWGKMNWRTAEDLGPSYPRFEDFLKVRDRLDPERVFTNAYLDRILGK
jgi:L-gulono-1,4-lactone dehydrogenase